MVTASNCPQSDILEVQPSSPTFASKLAAIAPPIIAIISATGLKIGGVEFKTSGVIAFCAVLIVANVTGAILWDRSQQRAQRRLELSMENLANKDRVNVVSK